MAQHPLDSLSTDELRRTAEIIRQEGRVTDGWLFASIELKEPEKSFVKAWSPGDAVPRHSFAVLLDRRENKTYEATVDLVGESVLSFEYIPGVQPNFTLDEFYEMDEAMRKHPDVIAALAERGYTDMSLILIDTWAYAKALMPASVELARARLVRPVGPRDTAGESLRPSGLRPSTCRRYEHP